VVCAILKGKIPQADVPAELWADIHANFSPNAYWTCEAFTAYPDGAPRHGSYPAMHSAASNLSFWLQIVMHADDRQVCAAKKIDYAVSYARTVAGVHYPQDNIVGLNLGQEVLARNFCDHITKKFHGNYDYCMWKVHQKRFDWRSENPKNFKECAAAEASKPSTGGGDFGVEVEGGDLVGITAPSQKFGPSFDELAFCEASEV